MTRTGGDATAEPSSELADPQRLEAIARSGLGPNAEDEALDRHTRLAGFALDAPVALLSIVDDTNQFFPSHVGLDEPWSTLGSTPLALSYCAFVVTGDEPFVVSDSETDPRVADNEARRVLGVRSYLGVPVRTAEGTVLGSLCVLDHEPRRWTDRQVAAMRDIADAMETELQLRSTAERLAAGLAAERRRLANESAFVTLASATSRAEGVLATADALAEHGAAAVGAAVLSVGIVDGDELVFHHGPDAGDQVAADLQRAALSADLPMARAAATGQPVHLADRAAIEGWPLLAGRAERFGLESFRAVPVSTRGSGVSAVIGAGWTHPVAEVDCPSTVDRLVTLAAQALDSGERFETELDHARTLEGLVLPSLLPSTPTMDIAAAYVAPGRGQRVGGDVYDAVVRDDGAIGVLIGDAVGHDVLAARTSSLLRHAVAMLILGGSSPAAVLRSVNRYVTSSPDRRLATCSVVLVDPARSTVTVANAGHPRPVLVHDGRAIELGPTRQPLLGFRFHEYRQETSDFPAGAALVAYTDGLLEQTDGGMEAGLALIGSNLADSATETVRQLIATVADTNRDDVAVLAVLHRATAPADGAGRVLQLRWSAEDVDLPAARAAVRRWAEGSLRSIDPVRIGDLELAVTELLTNARDSSPRPDSPIGVRLEATRSGVELVVQNVGRRFQAAGSMPAAGAERGRGLAMVAAVSDQLEVGENGGFIEVRARFDLP